MKSLAHQHPEQSSEPERTPSPMPKGGEQKNTKDLSSTLEAVKKDPNTLSQLTENTKLYYASAALPFDDVQKEIGKERPVY